MILSMYVIIKTICQAIAGTKTMTAQQVVKNDVGEEVNESIITHDIRVSYNLI